MLNKADISNKKKTVYIFAFLYKYITLPHNCVLNVIKATFLLRNNSNVDFIFLLKQK